MNRRLLLVEPDASARAMLDRVLAASGYAVESRASSRDAGALLDEGAVDLAVVDQFAGAPRSLDEVRVLRARHPRLPVVVTGTMLLAPTLLELLRLGVADALPKPFTPTELRASVDRALGRASPWHDASRDYAAALDAARRALSSRETQAAGRALARAWALCPLDADVMALEALRAELDGRGEDAARGYRATLALRHDEASDGPDPYEGLARLAGDDMAEHLDALRARLVTGGDDGR